MIKIMVIIVIVINIIFHCLIFAYEKIGDYISTAINAFDKISNLYRLKAISKQ